MAIIFNIGESLKQSAFNILQEPIKMLMENEKEAFEKERQETEVGSAAIGAVVETNGNIRKNCEI